MGTQTRLKKGEKRAKTRESRFSLFFFLHFSFSCCGTRALHVLWRRFLWMEENRITCFFAAHTYLCAGKAMHWFFSLCAPWEHASIVCGICKVCIGLLFVNHNQAKQKKTKQVASRWLGDASCLINASCVLRGSAGALEKEHASASLLTAKLAHASTHFLQQQQQLMTCPCT